MARARTGGVAAMLMVATVLVACSAGSSTAPSSPASNAASAGPSAQASQPSASSDGSSLAVDLTFSGPLALTARGSAGQCVRGTDSQGTPVFSFQATDADYAGLGDGFFVDQTVSPGAGEVLDIKLLTASGQWFQSVTTGWNWDPATLTMTFDIDLVGASSGTEHIAGTVSCPQ